MSWISRGIFRPLHSIQFHARKEDTAEPTSRRSHFIHYIAHTLSHLQIRHQFQPQYKAWLLHQVSIRLFIYLGLHGIPLNVIDPPPFFPFNPPTDMTSTGKYFPCDIGLSLHAKAGSMGGPFINHGFALHSLLIPQPFIVRKKKRKGFIAMYRERLKNGP